MMKYLLTHGAISFCEPFQLVNYFSLCAISVCDLDGFTV